MRRSVLLLLLSALLTCFPFGALRAQNAERQWTSREGVSITATLVEEGEEEVILKLKNGKEATVPLSRLSDYDLNYLKELRQSGLGVGSGKLPLETSIDDDLTTDGGPRIFTTPNFEFEADRDLSKGFVAEAARVFEGTLQAIKSMPLGLEPKTPGGELWFKVRFLGRDTFETTLRGEKIPAPDEVVGMYLPMKKVTLVPFTSIGAKESGGQMTLRKRNDTSVLVHEITHHVMHDWLALLPVWMTEGFSEYMAAMPYQNGRFEFKNSAAGLKLRLKEKYDSESPTLMHPEDFLMAEPNDWSGTYDEYLSAMMLTYYFIHMDRGGQGETMASYLALIKDTRDETDTFILEYNMAVKDFEKKRLAFNAAIEKYNAGVAAYRKAVDEYVVLGEKYNEQTLAGVPKAERVKVPEQPEPPIPPEKPEIPEILQGERPDAKGPVNVILSANAKARPVLLRGRDIGAIAVEMKAGFARIGIPVTFRKPGEEVGRFNKIGEDLNKRLEGK